MEQDRLFGYYAFGLIGAVVVLFACLVSAGIAELPGLDFLVEHAGLAVLFRASYKSFDGEPRLRNALERSGMITGDGAHPFGAAGATS